MSPHQVVDIFQNALSIVVIASCIIIIPGLVIGLCVAVFQAATQINEMTLNFIPKLLVTIAVLGLAGPWLLRQIMEYTITLFNQIPDLIG